MKPYEVLIACVLRDLEPCLTEDQLTTLIHAFMPVLKRNNPDFDEYAFLRFILKP